MSTILRKSESGGRRLFGSSKDKKNKQNLESFDVRDNDAASMTSSRSSQFRATPAPPAGRNTTSGAVPVAPAQVVPPAMTQNASFSSSVFNSGMNGHGDDPDAISVIGQSNLPSTPPPAAPVAAPAQHEIDAEGYSIPPPVAKGSAVAEMDETYGELQQDSANHSLAIDIQSAPLKDQQDEEQAARDHVASSLRMKPTATPSRSMRGRRGENAASKLYAGGIPALAGDIPALPAGLTKLMNNGHPAPPPPPSHRGSLESTRRLSSEIVEEKSTEEKAVSPIPKLPAIATDQEIGEKEEFHSAVDDPSLSHVSSSGLNSVSSIPIEERDENENAPLTGVAVEEPAEIEEEVDSVPETPVSLIPVLPDLTSSVVETVNVSLHGGSPARVLIVGDVALSYSGAATQAVPLRLTNTELVDRIHPNSQVITSVEDDEDELEDGYVLHPDRLSAIPTIAFKYSLTSADYVPVIVTPSWKFEERQTSVIVRYVLNPAYPADELVLSEMSLVVSIEGAQATAAQSKPSGVFNREAGHLAIVLTSAESPEIRLRKGVEGNALVRFWTEGLAKEGNGGRGGVSLSFRFAPEDESKGVTAEIKDATDLKESDPFADESEGEWAAVPVIRSIVSGMYFASAE